ncbi:MAG: thioredoxin domain-containing protein, partial [Patescibacteria group bacterium]
KGKVNLVYRHFPLEQLHSKAPKEAEATECAAELGGNAGFWKYLDRMMEITPSNDGLDPAKLPEIAKEVGLDQKKFEECYKSGKYAGKVQAQYNEGLAAGAQGTPYGIILAGDQKIPIPGAVPLEQIKATIDPFIK